MKAKFILSKKKLLEQYNKVKNAADFVSYSLKTNPFVGRILEETTGCFFSIHSLNYIDAVKDKKRVWFFLQAINNENLDLLFKQKVTSFIADNENDLHILLDYIKKKNCSINLLLRMKLREHTIHTGKIFVFGISADRINKLIPELRKNSSIKELGIHFHRKTQNISEWELKEEIIDSLNKETLKNIDIVDIGGGIPVRYKNYSNESVENIFQKIIELKKWLNEKSIKMIIEPGRFLAAPCINLEAEIVNIYNNNIVINCSVYNSAMDTFVAHIRLEVKGEAESEIEGEAEGYVKTRQKGIPYTIKGITPDSMDIFRYRVFLKQEPKIRDKIVFLNAGAYTFSTDFCNLEKLETAVVD